jgi:hypothetical protein
VPYRTVPHKGRKGIVYYQRVYPRKHIQRAQKRQMRLSLTRSAAPKWHRALTEGVLPAYDEALKVLRWDSLKLKDEAEAFRKEVVQVEKELDGLTAAGAEEPLIASVDARLEKMREKLEILTVQSEINLPHVRWLVRQKSGLFFFVFYRVLVAHLNLSRCRYDQYGT